MSRALDAIARRRWYALVFGGAFWALMGGRVVLEGGRWKRGGLPVGWDFHIFRAAGKLVEQGDGARLYDPAALRMAAKALLPGDYPVWDYMNPPHYAALFAPVTSLPHPVAFGLFSAVNVVLLALGMKLLGALSARRLAYLLSAYPVVYGLFSGQNCFLSFALAALVAASVVRGRSFTAGCAAAALLYKPQFAAGFVLLFLLDGKLRARALSGFALTGLLVVVANALVSPEATRSYLELVPSLPERHTQFRPGLAFTTRGFFELLLPHHASAAVTLGALTSSAAVLGYALFVRSTRDPALRVAGAVWVALAVTPHASVYDWTLLIVPLVILRKAVDAGRWALVATALFVTSYLSPTVAEETASAFGFGLQLAMPVFFGVTWYAVGGLRRPQPTASHA